MYNIIIKEKFDTDDMLDSFYIKYYLSQYNTEIFC